MSSKHKTPEEELTISQVDVSAGLSHMRGNRELLKASLFEFIDNQSKFCLQFRVEVECMNLLSALAILQMFSAQAALVGATELVQLSAKIEKEVTKETFDVNVLVNYLNAINEIMSLIYIDVKKLRTVNDDPGFRADAKGYIRTNDIDSFARELSRMLSSNDANSLRFIRKNFSKFNIALGQKADVVYSLVCNFEFAEARIELANVM